jgi:DNA-binding transcriptional MerR regulator
MNGLNLFGSGEVAQQLGIPRWKLLYLIEKGDLPRPSQTIAGRRLFTQDDVLAIRQALIAREKEDVDRLTVLN